MVNGEVIKFRNCFIIRDHKIQKEDFYVREGKILNPEPLFYDEKKSADVVIDCHGCLIAPGLIDLQINGGFGIDFSYDIVDSDTAKKSIDKVSKGLLAHGVTAFCPTLVTSPSRVYYNILPHIKKRPGGKDGAAVLGVHVEGPFISKDKKGAHPAEYILEFENGFDTISQTYGDLSNVKIITMAPEKDPQGEIIRECVNRGICVSIGHTMATLTEGEAAFRNGASLITHLFNAMASFHHRDPGLAGLLTSNKTDGRQVYYGVIADGIHTHPTALRIAFQTNFDGMCLVSDAITALGLEDGRYVLGQMEIEVQGNRAVLVGTNTLCGAIATLFQAVKNLQKFSRCSLVEALEAASLHPAAAIGLKGIKGTLDYGADADFILIDQDEMSLLSTWIAGEKVFEAC